VLVKVSIVGRVECFDHFNITDVEVGRISSQEGHASFVEVVPTNLGFDVLGKGVFVLSVLSLIK
jgi:hypothetical protein